MKTSKALQKCNSKVKKEDAKAVKIAETQSGADVDFTSLLLSFGYTFVFLPPRLEDESKISLSVSEMNWSELEMNRSDPAMNCREPKMNQSKPQLRRITVFSYL